MAELSFSVQSIRQETGEVKSFLIKAAAPFSYLPGQFLTIVRGDVRRSFSFSSHPSDEWPTITLKRIPNGVVSRWLFDEVKEGDRIDTIGASGFFALPEDLSSYESIVFLAAGTGIAPVYSLLKEVLHFRDHRKVILVYSSRSESQTVFYNDLQDLQRRYSDRFVIEHFFSSRHDLKRARLGRLALEELLKRHLTTPSAGLFYLCGPHVYMQNITITLLTEGVDDENIRREIFYSPLPPVTAEPPDKAPHEVKVEFEGKIHTLTVQWPKSILQTAKAQGILLPYSCESGRCGTCAATCTKGEVWMLRNEVLVDKEMARGRVLTCTGFAIGGDAAVKFE